MAMSTSTAPGFMVLSMARVTSLGAVAPGTSTAPITRSAVCTASSTAAEVEYRVRINPLNCLSSSASRGLLRSNTVTIARIPTAISAACVPDTPPPRITTFAGATPGTPPSKIPRPRRVFIDAQAATCIDIRPATWLMGTSSGRRPASSVTVS